jgi:hypothetical protein
MEHPLSHQNLVDDPTQPYIRKSQIKVQCKE